MILATAGTDAVPMARIATNSASPPLLDAGVLGIAVPRSAHGRRRERLLPFATRQLGHDVGTLLPLR
jgi:hypothetical protein